MAPHTVSVTILDKEYQVACPEDQAADLAAAASYLDNQMRAIRDTGKVIG
ncbi:MAG TPA: cell division protein ZapA, partial [Pseudohaliea sp.]|nr:cell division protein ZapA [Pseudohaliea sp.]